MSKLYIHENLVRIQPDSQDIVLTRKCHAEAKGDLHQNQYVPLPIGWGTQKCYSIIGH